MGLIKSSKVYTDGSFNMSQNRAGFAAVFADDLGATIKSRIPGHQSAIRAELFAILAALKCADTFIPLTIYSDCQLAVNTLNALLSQKSLPYYQTFKLEHRSIILEIIAAFKLRKTPTTLCWIRAHTKNEGTSFTMNAYADKAAKSTLRLQCPLVPDCTEHRLGATLVDNNESSPSTAFIESSPFKHIRNTFQDLNLHLSKDYVKRNWFQVLNNDLTWQEPYSIENKKGASLPGYLRRFQINVLGRSLPTLHRMKVLRPKLFSDSTCPFCKNETSCYDETIEHVFYDCPAFETSRKAFLASITGIVSLEIPGLSKSHVSHSMKEIFIQPRHEDEVRFRSAGQIPLKFKSWAIKHVSSPSKLLALARRVHNQILEELHTIWYERCNRAAASKHLFKDYMCCIPSHISHLRDMTDDDQLAFQHAVTAMQRKVRSPDGRIQTNNPVCPGKASLNNQTNPSLPSKLALGKRKTNRHNASHSKLWPKKQEARWNNSESWTAI
jgi:ribonuclease HI